MVTVALLGPDGKAVADRPVWVFPFQGQNGYPSNTQVRFEGRTDAQGRFVMRWFEGKRRLRVLVPGLGFGSTGMFEVLRNRPANPQMPRLARFARVEGILAPPLAGQPQTLVKATHDNGMGGANDWDRAEAGCDDKGRFVLTDVVPGLVSLSVSQAGSAVKAEPRQLQLAPGQALTALVIRPEKPPEAKGPMPEAPVGPPGKRATNPKQEFVWVDGTIKDETGQPLPGATVFARTAFHGGIRMYEDVRKTTADGSGHYQIKGPVWDFMDSLAVVAFVNDRPPMVAYAPAPLADLTARRQPLDLAVAARGGRLRVTVIREGKPLRGAWVRLESDGVAGLTQWARKNPLGGKELDPYFTPTARTGADGVAQFTNLFPGTYQILANEGDHPIGPRVLWWARDSDAPFGVADNISVAAGQEIEFSLAIHAQPAATRFRVLRPNGTPVADQAVSFQFGLQRPSVSAFLKLDAQGIGSYSFASPGLWAVDVRFFDSELKSSPVSEEPYYQAEVLVPVSPALKLDEPMLLQGVRHDRGSLRVRLLDLVGQPARGTVMIVNGAGLDPNGIQYAGTTDAQGEVRFPDLPSGQYELRGAVDGVKPPFDPGPSGPYPDDDESLKGALGMTELAAKVEAGSETFAELRLRPVGYLRGIIHPPAGRKIQDYHLGMESERPWFQTSWRLDPASGKFTYGPLPAGQHKIKIYRVTETSPWPTVATHEVNLSDGVTRLEVRPPEEPGADAPPSQGREGKMMLGMGGLSHEGVPPPGSGGTVRMPNGVAPAIAARGLLFVPGQEQPVASGVSDAAGNLTWRGRWISGGGSSSNVGKAVEKPRAVIWLPGMCGAVVVDVEASRPVRAVLPDPLAASGRVTLGGKAIDGRNARVRVLAAHQGQGVLNSALSLSTSARSDGRFNLRGLTPGRYRVQAVRDEIWLSKSVEIQVEKGKAVPDLALDIAEPGATVVVEVVDRQGGPIAGRPLKLARPAGPLASLWPAGFRTDQAGKLTLRGLEAGTHLLQIEGESEQRPLHVPEIRDDVARVEVVRFVSGKAE
jgi:protocatechuate 3,4-dioxygenase beta subunit